MSQLEPLKEKAGNACGDKDQKCCICIPLETGMKILGCLFCLGAILIGLGLVQCIAYNIIIAIVIGAILLPYLYLCFIWFKWMREDNEENCKMVVKAMNIYKIVECCAVKQCAGPQWVRNDPTPSGELTVGTLL